jgi:hypothetical protein
MTAGLVQAPILFVRCEGGDGIVAKAAISSTWFGVAGPDGAIIDRTAC